MKWFVFYSDDYDECGLEEFDSKKEAEDFIDERMKAHGSTTENYKVIEGREHIVGSVEVTTKVKIMG